MYKEIKGEVDKIRRKYIESAEEIVSGYNRECGLSKDYEGRQMFELLQNADDESEGSAGKVLITFDGKTLSVSNTGKPFSFRGVKSLLYPNASPKRIHANKIGCKGLGFRSILSWANSVTVASADFTIQFSREYAAEFLDSILAEKPSLQSEIKALTTDAHPIATLTCPRVLERNALIEGFSTSIIVECKKELSETIEKQITGLEFEELIFLPNLKEIEIQCNGYHKTFFKISEGNEVIIETLDMNTREAKCSSWMLFRQTGSVVDENGGDKEYEFIIAYDPTGEHIGEVLYSYFKTDVKLGFPALIHGTFELTSDRNSLLKESNVNQQLISLLADFMVQTAVDIAESQKECDYLPLRLVVTSDIDKVLEKNYSFDSLLRDKARGKRILPTISNQYISVNDEPRYSDEAFAKYLSPSTFVKLLKNTEDENIKTFLKKDLGIVFYTYNDFCSLINGSLANYSMDQKVAIIALIENVFRAPSKTVFPHLLVDNNGTEITDSSKVYPLPNEEQVIALPEWVDIRFLNPEMEKKLFKKLGMNNSRRELTQALSRYNLEEYSFDRLLHCVLNQVADTITSKDRCCDILNWLWCFYDRDDRQPISDTPVKVICRDGKIRYAKDCYIGREYGNELGERLVSSYSNQFITGVGGLGLQCKDVVRAASFLEWLGASKYPRITEKTLTEEEQNQFVKVCYPLYVQRDNCSYDSSEFPNISSVTVGCFEKLEVILEEVNFNDLLAWFLVDEKINSRISCETEEKNSFACIKGWPARKVDQRRVAPEDIKSYLLFYLRKHRWIPDADGRKEDPAHCCFEDNDLAPFIIVPSVDYGYLKDVIGRNCRKDIDALLRKIGVADTFQEMDKVVIYEALMKLPELDKERKKGKSLYRKIIRDGATPDEYKANNPAYAEFMKHGSVLVKKNYTRQYVPVSEARYADKKVLSDEILKNFSMFDVDARSGEDKIEKLFGVKPLKNVKIEINGEPTIHSLNEKFEEEYRRFLPFVFACRMGLKNAEADFRRLKSTKITLCSYISIMCWIERDFQLSQPPHYQPVYLRENNIAYISVPEAHSLFESLKGDFDFADAVAELVTAILDVNEGKDFFRDLFRDTTDNREKKMRLDKGDENLEALTAARRRFASGIDPRAEFWRTVAEIMKTPASENASVDELIALLGLGSGIDDNIDFDILSHLDNAPFIVSVFTTLSIDIADYNRIAAHTVDISKYWRKKLYEKTQLYRPKYQAYLFEKWKKAENGVQRYIQDLDQYDALDPGNMNSVMVDINSVFENKCGVSFESLDSFPETFIKNRSEEEKAKISADEWESLCSSTLPSTIEAYLLFGKIGEPTMKEEYSISVPCGANETESKIRELLKSVFSSPTDGFVSVGIERTGTQVSIHDGKTRQHQKRIYSETVERKKQENGLVGEAVVFRELQKLYRDVRWVSGNGKKAYPQEIEGDDTCGYDIRYIDENGCVQYVEVKASKSENIVFSLSSNELRFACRNAKNYEIIFVVISEDGKSAHKLWRFGHLFDFDEGEDLLHNRRFSIESDNYIISAKSVEDAKA